jgi:tetratricopeptide (TPR) repeat protein
MTNRSTASGKWSQLGLVLLALSIPLPAGCQSGLTASDRKMLNEAAQYYEQGSISPSLYRLDRIIREHGKEPEVAEAYYLRGLCRSKVGQLQPAALDFVEAINRSKRPDLAAKAKASLAQIHFKWGNWERAADLYAEAVNNLDKQVPNDVILYDAGVAMQRAGRWNEARLQFGRVLTDFRDRPVTRDAYLKATWRYDYFCIQVGTFHETDKAEASVRAFAAKGLDTWEELRPGTNPRRWVVLTGRFPTYVDALAALPRVRKIQADACIVP